MKTIEQLEQAYQKELGLSEKHKKTAADIRRQIELQQGKQITQKINALNMSGAEYDRFIKLLASGKKTVMQVADQVLGVHKEEIRGGVNESESQTPRAGGGLY